MLLTAALRPWAYCYPFYRGITSLEPHQTSIMAVPVAFNNENSFDHRQNSWKNTTELLMSFYFKNYTLLWISTNRLSSFDVIVKQNILFENYFVVLEVRFVTLSKGGSGLSPGCLVGQQSGMLPSGESVHCIPWEHSSWVSWVCCSWYHRKIQASIF